MDIVCSDFVHVNTKVEDPILAGFNLEQ